MPAPITTDPAKYAEIDAATTANLVAVPATVWSVTLTTTTAQAIDSTLVDSTDSTTPVVLTLSHDAAGTQHYEFPRGIRFNTGVRWVDGLTTGAGRITISYNT